MLIELKNFEISRHVSSSVDPQGEISRMDTPVGVIQTGTRITTQFDAIMGTDEQQVSIHVHKCMYYGLVIHVHVLCMYV